MVNASKKEMRTIKHQVDAVKWKEKQRKEKRRAKGIRFSYK